MIDVRELPFEQRSALQAIEDATRRNALARAEVLERACIQAIAQGCGVRVDRSDPGAEPVVAVDPRVPAGMIHEHLGWETASFEED